MTTREKVLEVSRKTIEHLKAISKLQGESRELYESNREEVYKLSKEDEEVRQLFKEIGELTEEIGF